MVRFEKGKFTIEVKTGPDPIEAWLKTIDELVDLLQSEDEEMSAYRFHLLDLMRSMMPDIKTAGLMTSSLKKDSQIEQTLKRAV